jgi:hypothetical protein
MPPRDSSIAAIVTLETILVFLLGIFGSKIANSINIPPTILFTVTLFGIIAVAYISYLKYTYNSTKRNGYTKPDKPSKQHTYKTIARLSLLNPTPIPPQLSTYDLDKIGDPVLSKSTTLSVLIGVIIFPLTPWLNDWLVLLCALSAIAINFIVIIPILKLPSNEKGFGRLYEILGLLFLSCVISFMTGLVSLLAVLIFIWLLGIKVPA